MSERTYETTWSTSVASPMQPSKVRLRPYTGESIKVVGSIDLKVEHKGQEAEVSLLIVDGDGPTLMGRDWLRRFINWDWAELHRVDGTDHASKRGTPWHDMLTCSSLVWERLTASPRSSTSSPTPNRGSVVHAPSTFSTWSGRRSNVKLTVLLRKVLSSLCGCRHGPPPVVPIMKKDGSIRLVAITR